METPIRDQIRLDNLWQSQRISPQSRSVFIPSPWEGSEIHLIPRKGVRRSEQPLPFTFGTWNRLEGNASLDGARLVASPPLHIKRVDSRRISTGLLSVQVDLSRAQICVLHATLSEPNGHQVAGARMEAREPADHLSADLDLPVRLVPGSYRLKVVMTVREQIMDNARVDVLVSI